MTFLNIAAFCLARLARSMSARARVLTVVSVAAGLAVAGTVGVTLLQSRGQGTTAPGAVTKPRQGRPPVFLEFGVRDDLEAKELSHAADLLNAGKAPQPPPTLPPPP